MKRLILASGSRYRAQQLHQLGIDFDVQPADIDETPLPQELASDLVNRLALSKARAIDKDNPDAVVIGSDQVAVLDRKVIGKPGDRESACRQLRAASGREVRFFTGLCVLAPGPDQAARHLDITTVHVRALAAAEIERYVEAESPLDCAGSFKCEGLGIALFEAIETRDPSALIGLPLIALARMLRHCGYQLP